MFAFSHKIFFLYIQVYNIIVFFEKSLIVFLFCYCVNVLHSPIKISSFFVYIILLFCFKVFVILYTRAFFVLHTYNKLTCKITVQWRSKGGQNRLEAKTI